MARDRQRAKQRQAARRQARLEDGAPGRGLEDPSLREKGGDDPAGEPDFDLAAGAPPQTAGRTDTIFGTSDPSSSRIPEAEELDDDEAAALEREALREERALDGSVPSEAVGASVGRSSEQQEGRGSLLSRLRVFLVGCLDELRRVKWPNRSQLFSLTGVVLGFCLIAGGYLGLLDLVFSRLIQSIL